MKRFLLAALTVFTAAQFAQAQQAVPNGGFENWAPRNQTPLAPTSWLTTDDLFAAFLGPLAPATNTVRRVTPARGGSYAAEMVDNSVTFLDPTTLMVQTAVLPGIMSLGNTSVPAASAVSGLPYTSRPAALEFFYKLTGANAASDSAAVSVVLTRFVNGQQEVIAEADSLILTPASTFTRFTLPLNYQSGAIPDTLYVDFVSSIVENPTAGTSLIIDDVAFTGTIAATRDLVADAALSVYPTASADGQFTLSTGNQPALLRGALRVTDATGREVLRQPAPAAPLPSRAIDLRGQAPGIYVLRLETASGPLTRKLVVL